MNSKHKKNITARITLYCMLSFLTFCSAPPKEKEMKLNDIQVIGSHNSYKQKIEPPVMQMILARDSNGIGLDYYHLPIREQLDLGLRGLEIDVLHDPAGGRYKKPLTLKLLEQKKVKTLPYDSMDQLSKPGLKVLHVPDIDFRSHCLTFTACLMEVKEWSDANPDHLPIIITVNPKDSGIREPGFTAVLPFTANVLDSLDQEILSVFPVSQLITPDEVTGKFSSLREAVTTQGWPSLESTRGRILFVLDAGVATIALYVSSSLKGKPMFPNVGADQPDAAFFIMNDPKAQRDDIQEKVRAGFMVRTRADADTREARTHDISRLEAAIASGAQLISTDYYLSRLSPSGDFQVILGNKKYQTCNPVTAPANCGL